MRLHLPHLAPYRLRLLLRAAFLFLMMATVGLALSVLLQEKQLSYKNYQSGFHKTKEQVSATLRHPSSQLALLNPDDDDGRAALHPLLLPFAALDFDDQQKRRHVGLPSAVRQQRRAVRRHRRQPVGRRLHLCRGQLVPHPHGEQAVDQAHRVRVKVALRGQTYEWIAPFEEIADDGDAARGMHGRLTG